MLRLGGAGVRRAEMVLGLDANRLASLCGGCMLFLCLRGGPCGDVSFMMTQSVATHFWVV